MSYEIRRLPVEEALERYTEFKEHIHSALKYSSGEWTAVQIMQSVITEPSIFQIWEILKDNCPVAFGTTKYLQYHNFTAMHIMTLTGDTDGDIVEWSRIFEEEMKNHPEVDCLELTGRRGFVKQLEKAGWDERYTTMRKSLKATLKI
jgi:hypothetical protein